MLKLEKNIYEIYFFHICSISFFYVKLFKKAIEIKQLNKFSHKLVFFDKIKYIYSIGKM